MHINLCRLVTHTSQHYSQLPPKAAVVRVKINFGEESCKLSVYYESVPSNMRGDIGREYVYIIDAICVYLTTQMQYCLLEFYFRLRTHLRFNLKYEWDVERKWKYCNMCHIYNVEQRIKDSVLRQTPPLLQSC